MKTTKVLNAVSFTDFRNICQVTGRSCQTQPPAKTSEQSTRFPHLSGLYVKTTERSHRKSYTHHRSDVSILSFLTRGAGQTLQRRQIFFRTKKKGHVRQHLRQNEIHRQEHKYMFFCCSLAGTLRWCFRMQWEGECINISRTPECKHTISQKGHLE